MKKKIIIYISLIISAVFLTMCTNTEKGAKKDLGNLKSKTENKISALSSSTKQYYENKLSLAKAKVSLEQAKMDLFITKDKQKAKKALMQAEKHLGSIKSSSNKKFNTGIATLKTGIDEAKQSVDKNYKTTGTKIDDLGKSIDVKINELDKTEHNEKSDIVNEYKRHYAELRAKEFLYKAKIAAGSKHTYDKASEYLNKADKQYIEAEKYGNKKYNSAVEDLRKDIMDTKTSLKTNGKKVITKINKLLIKLGKYSYSQTKNIDYPYMMYIP